MAGYMMVLGYSAKNMIISPAKLTCGEEAKRLRLACLLTQQKVAEMAGIPRQQVDLLEHNYPVPLDSKRRVFRELWALKIKK
jgi:DNA-binding XRE family transcriptional regulator